MRQNSEREKGGSRQESNFLHLAWAASALPLSHNNQTTTIPHNPLHVLHTSIPAQWFTVYALHKPVVQEILCERVQPQQWLEDSVHIARVA